MLPNKAIYVITSLGADIFADMALLSMMSVRISNPCLRLVVLADKQSANNMRNHKHRLLGVCDEFIAIDTPDGEPSFRNRWIKTQLNKFVPGDALYLDADTLVRRRLDDIFETDADFSGVPNNNGKNINEQMWDQDHRFIEQMQWPFPVEPYFNGGVWFFRQNERSDDLFSKWHEFWQQGHKTLGQFRDQPALNRAIFDSNAKPHQLPMKYNLQIRCAPEQSGDAAIWHFFSSFALEAYSIGRLVNVAPHRSLSSLTKLVAYAIEAPVPWPNFGFFPNMVARRVAARGWPTDEERLWLTCQTRQACQHLVLKFLHRLRRGLFRSSR
jgi:hypothetical protein